MNNNFLGEPFNQWVKTQVEVRQESLGKYSKEGSYRPQAKIHFQDYSRV